MAVIFDYTAYLQNSDQIMRGAYPSSVGEVFVNPNAAVFFWSLFNPGHTGTTSVIEYFLDPLFTVTATPGDLDYTWQIKASGGSWVTLTGAEGTVTTTGGKLDTGVYTTAVLMPCEIQLIGTDAADDWKVTTGNVQYCILRAVGTV